MNKRQELTGRSKAATLLVSLGPDLSAEVFKHLRDDEIEQLTLEIANMRRVDAEVRSSVVTEFCQMCIAQDYISQGGIEYAKDVLEKALGSQRAVEFLHRLTSTLQVRPFDFIRKTDPTHLLNFIQSEHPQTIALIMAYLNPDQASVILSALPTERQADVARRMALMDRTSPDIIREVERVLERKLSTLVSEGFTKAGGVETLVDVLNRVDRGTEKTIMETLEVHDPELAEEIKRRMFLFEDVVFLDDKYVQRVLRDVDMQRDLPLALKAASDEVKTKIQRNMSKRAVELLQENIDFLGPVRLRDVEEAQQKIVTLIRGLEEEGEIIIARGGGDEILV